MASTAEGMIALFQAIESLQMARYTNAAATTIYLYDILITLDQEVEHIWSRLSFTLPTLLYILNRYICFAFFLVTTYDLAGFHGPFTDDECRTPKEIVGMMLWHTSWTGIMTIRVCAIWRQKRWLVRTIWVIWPCTMAAIIATGSIAHMQMISTLSYNPYVRICVSDVIPRILAITPVPPAIYELFLTILTIIKAFDFVGYLPSSYVPLLFRVLARDGVAYFAISTTISIANMIIWFTLPGSQVYLFLYLYWASLSTLISRMVLNLRAVHSRSMLEQSGTEGVSANVPFGYDTRSTIWEHGTRFVNGEGYLGVSTIVPKLAPVEEEPWNVQVFDVQSTPPLQLQRIDTGQRIAGP